ncbi:MULTISPECIES: tautomerase family protein [Xanthobacter]|uniref:tautomerase family protein n=1 Tax=Xanthobacter TaxID=279 RepID=UPI002022EC6F|nr:2-hydroxymuconate tautomerase family protein [Xanthobacter aminoxidans]MCL8383443.1 2-hydroxymuconate tautomerase family protein [Xanthobacter aminoxidans]
MPIVTVALMEGRTQEQKDAMFARVTEALCATLDCRPEQVRIRVEDMSDGDFAVAGKSVARSNAERESP